MRHLSGGFTFLELLIVISLFGLITAMTFPIVSRISTHARVNQAATVVAQDLSLALSAAARERKPLRLAVGLDRQSIIVSERATGTVLTTRSLGLGDAYQLDSVTLSASPVDLFPTGFASSALTVTLWAGGYSRRVTMSRAGWVRVP